MTTITHSQLTYCPESKLFVGEISELEPLQRVYDGAGKFIQLGVTVVGRTGREVVFVLDRIHTDADGDITHWMLVPAKAADREQLGVTLTIFND